MWTFSRARNQENCNVTLSVYYYIVWGRPSCNLAWLTMYTIKTCSIVYMYMTLSKIQVSYSYAWLGSKISVTCTSHDIKDTVNSASFHSGTGCYGRDGEHCEYDNQIPYNDHKNSLPVARLKERGKRTSWDDWKIRIWHNITCTWHLNYGCIPTNLSKTKSGTKSLKKRDFWSKIGTFLRILQKLAKIIKLIGTTVHKNIAKKVGSPLCIVYQEKQHGFVASIRGLSCHALDRAVATKFQVVR